jgi:hypothetical protein
MNQICDAGFADCKKRASHDQQNRGCFATGMSEAIPWLPFWYAAASDSPYLYSLIEIKRDEWEGKTEIVCPAQLHPEFNVWGLWWRPVKK